MGLTGGQNALSGLAACMRTSLVQEHTGFKLFFLILTLVIRNDPRILNKNSRAMKLDWKLMLVFYIPSVWWPHEDEEPALMIYGCPTSQDPLASTICSANSKKKKGEGFYCFLPKRKNLTLDPNWKQHIPGMEWFNLNRAQSYFTGDGLTHSRSAGEQWTEFKLTWTDACWHFAISSRTPFLQRYFSECLT